jgi:hypothetical protein
MTMARWPYGKVTIEVPCGGQTHRVEITDGKMHLLDHDPENVTMIEAFTTFGAKPPHEGCLELLMNWQARPVFVSRQLAPWPEEATHVECEDCGWQGTEEEAGYLGGIDDLLDRITPGYEVPAGECPECYSLVHLAFGPWQKS